MGIVVLAAGPKPWRHPIVALGAASNRGHGDVFETLVRPAVPCRIPAYLERFGVTAEGLERATALEPALDAFLAFIGDAALVGLDVGVAAAHLQLALRRLGRAPLDNTLIELATPESERPDLIRLARARAVPVPPRLTPGALATLASKLADATEERTETSALVATRRRELLDAGQLETVSDAPGVYLFRDADGRVLYVGKATSLRVRLGAYLASNFSVLRSMPGLIGAAERVEHEPLACELAARAREAELIAAHSPPYNVQRNRATRLAWARLVLSGEPDAVGGGVPRLRLELSHRSADGAHLVDVQAARSAFGRSRAAWWPTRLKTAERPRPGEVTARFAELRARFAADLEAAEFAGPWLVVAPRVPPRSVGEAELDDEWTREARDRAWPPAPPDATNAEAPSPTRPAALEPVRYDPRYAAMIFDAHGLRASVEVDAADEVSARRGVSGVTLLEAATGKAALASLAVLAAALARRETGLAVWRL